jgi:hypothetical protein
MSEAETPLLGRAEFERAFTLLGDRLARRGVVADIFVVGGAAIALAYDAKRVTRDVDALYVPHGIVHDEALEVARELGLPRFWLNEQASVYISATEDPAKKRVFDHPGLRVEAASPRHIFAMKALAARERDVPDLQLLAGLANIHTADAAIECARQFFPDEVMSQRAERVLAELFVGEQD